MFKKKCFFTSSYFNFKNINKRLLNSSAMMNAVSTTHILKKHVIQSTDSVQLCVHEFIPRVTKNNSKRKLLLAHATMFHGLIYSDLVRQFENRHCFSLDFRGFGDSSCGTLTTPSWHGFKDDVLAVIDQFDLRGCDGIGHSKGAASILLAEACRPGSFNRLVCFEPIVFPGTGNMQMDEHPYAVQARRRKFKFDSRRQALERFQSSQSLRRLEPNVLQSYVEHGLKECDDGSFELKADRLWEAAVYVNGGAPHENFDQIQCPVLIVVGGLHGSEFAATPASFAPKIAKLIRNSKVLTMPNATHFGALEDSKAFANVCKSFFENKLDNKL